VGKREVDVNSRTSLVDLGNAETDPNLINLETFLNTLIGDARPNPFAHLAHVGPWAGCFKALSSNEVILGKISGVSDQECEQVASHTVLSPTTHALVLGSKIQDHFVIFLAFSFTAFKEKRAGNEFVLLVPFDLENKEFLSAFNKGLP
jgi:hypothetical protein